MRTLPSTHSTDSVLEQKAWTGRYPYQSLFAVAFDDAKREPRRGSIIRFEVKPEHRGSVLRFVLLCLQDLSFVSPSFKDAGRGFAPDGRYLVGLDSSDDHLDSFADSSAGVENSVVLADGLVDLCKVVVDLVFFEHPKRRFHGVEA